MRAIVAMSGGVDSSVAAHLLKKQGIEVIGLSFQLWDRRDLAASGTCCSIETIELAKSVARDLGIEHFTVDVRDAFYHHVIEEFCESYMNGRTPNPCILCNKYIKFDFLLQKARELNAGLVATGHYAKIDNERVMTIEGGKLEDRDRVILRKGADTRKDQSYVLYVMKQDELAKTLFPLGKMTKNETRHIAADLGLSNALRAESQEICFVGDRTYADFIRDFSPESLRPGLIVDRRGDAVGEHRGIAFYTIGQRRGLGIASAEPLYVVGIDRRRNTIRVGSRDEAMGKRFIVEDINWISIDSLATPFRCSVKIRSTMREVPATLIPESDGRVLVSFDKPQWAPAPGQSAVFYDNDIVIGGGIIEQEKGQ